MSSYQTPSQFRAYSIASGSFDAVPDDVVQEYLNVAADEINSALAVKHSEKMPLTNVPSMVLEWERVICAWMCIQNEGVDPGSSAAYLEKRYEQVVGTGAPDSGILGQMAYGLRALVTDDDDDPGEFVTNTPSYKVVGSKPRGWYTRINGRDFIT